MALTKTAVGNLLYVFSVDGKKNKKAMITAHGGTSNINGMQNVPQCKLLFYSEHGHILTDPGVLAVACGRCIPKDEIQSRSSQDYELSKYQNSEKFHLIGDGKHNTGTENYTSISGLDAEFAKAFARYENGTDSLSIERQQIYREIKMDIITIRNRTFHRDPTLSVVLKELTKHGYAYEEIHCSFCRGGLEAQKPQQKW